MQAFAAVHTIYLFDTYLMPSWPDSVAHIASGAPVSGLQRTGLSCPLPVELVSVREGCFFSLAESIFVLACAAYRCTPPRNPSISWPGEKIPTFRNENQQFLIRSLRMETNYRLVIPETPGYPDFPSMNISGGSRSEALSISSQRYTLQRSPRLVQLPHISSRVAGSSLVSTLMLDSQAPHCQGSSAGCSGNHQLGWAMIVPGATSKPIRALCLTRPRGDSSQHQSPSQIPSSRAVSR